MEESLISAQMTIESILTTWPQRAQHLRQALTRAGLHCATCDAAQWETLEQGMQGHGKSVEEISELLKELNEILQKPLDASTIVVTPAAAEKFKALALSEGKPQAGLRLGQEPGGCSGYQYTLDFSEAALPNDEIFASQGVLVHVESSLVPYLLGCEIDFVDSLYGGGFKVSNPNVRQCCPCGNSQGY